MKTVEHANKVKKQRRVRNKIARQSRKINRGK